jgi:hypothetical protein
MTTTLHPPHPSLHIDALGTSTRTQPTERFHEH